MAFKNRLQIFVVEDNKIYNHLVTEFLKRKKIEVTSFFNGKECMRAIKGGARPGIVIQDYHLGDTTGFEVLKYVKNISPKTEFIFLTSNEDMEVAVNTIKYGAFDYIIKDKLALDRVMDKIQKIYKIFDLERKHRQIKVVMFWFAGFIFFVFVFALLFFVFNVFNMS